MQNYPSFHDTILCWIISILVSFFTAYIIVHFASHHHILASRSHEHAPCPFNISVKSLSLQFTVVQKNHFTLLTDVKYL